MLAKGLGFAGAGSMQAAFQAGLTSLASQASVALVNNKGDLGAALRQLGSSLTLKSLATAMVAAGLGAELTQLAGLDKALPKNAVFADRVARSLQRNLLRSTVQASVATAIQGGKLDDALVSGLSDGAISAALSGVQHEIGSFGVEHGLPEGSIRKILAHALAGGLASELAGGAFADGAMAAALAEAAGPLLGNSGLGEETQIALQRLVGAAAILLRGSDVGKAMFAGGIAASAHRNNYLSHREIAEAKALQKKLQGCARTFGSGGGGCSNREIASLRQRLSALETISKAKTLRMIDVCKAGQASTCKAMLAEADAFNKQLPGRSSQKNPGSGSPQNLGMLPFYVRASPDTPINLDALAVEHYSRAVAGEIAYEEATEKIRTKILNLESTNKVIVGGVRVAAGVGAAVVACTATAGAACVAFAGLGAANAILGANTVSGGIDRMLSGENGRTLIEKGLIEAGYSKTEAAYYLANAERLVAVADLAAGGVLILRGPLGAARVGKIVDADTARAIDKITNKPIRSAKPEAVNRTLTSSSGNYTPTHATNAGDALDVRLPSRQPGQSTNGVLDVDGVEIHLRSGAQGPANRWYDPSRPAVNQTAAHVEGHAAALMVDNGITDMTVTINNRLGPCGVCQIQIPDLLPQGSTLNVRWMDRNGIVQTTPILGRAPTGQ